MRTEPFITASALLLVAVFAASCSKSPSSPAESSPIVSSPDTNTTTRTTAPPNDIIPAGTINLIAVDLPQFLALYADIASAQLDTSQLGKLPPVIIRFKNANDVTRSEAVRLLDKVLYDQAGIIVTHPDAKHALFEYRSREK